jgi:UMF1 family MFS transporter
MLNKFKSKTPEERIKRAWTWYDWANSAFPLVITATIFPIYYATVTTTDTDMVSLFGLQFVNTALYTYALSFAFLIVAIISPILSGIADYSGNKKTFLKFFCYLGSLSCAALFFFNGDTLLLGIVAFIFANIGFWASLVFYNSYLPEIAHPNEHDKLSAKGFSKGYIGSVLLLIASLILVLKPEIFGITDGSLPARISFVMVGLWWSGFSQITLNRLPDPIEKKKFTKKVLFNGYKELNKVWKQVKAIPNLKRYLIGFFFWSLSVQTIMNIASIFGTKELNLESGQLITTILIIQLIAVAGAYFFSWLSKNKGNKFSLSTSLIIWVGITIGAYFVYTAMHFYVLAVVVGFVMGGVQSMSRSTYSKLMPKTKDTASFFSFYDVTEKVSIVIGTFSFGFIEEITGTMRNSILLFGAFFLIGLLILSTVKMKFSRT